MLEYPLSLLVLGEYHYLSDGIRPYCVGFFRREGFLDCFSVEELDFAVLIAVSELGFSSIPDFLTSQIAHLSETFQI
jgi:hypothetical protein